MRKNVTRSAEEELSSDEHCRATLLYGLNSFTCICITVSLIAVLQKDGDWKNAFLKKCIILKW